MKIREISVSKGRKITTKQPDGGFDSHSADITLIVEAEEGVVNEDQIMDKVKELVEATLSDDPSWIAHDTEGKKVKN